jgi:hypothetical protein
VIPAIQPYVAHYKHVDNGRTYHSTKPVIAWDDDGKPLVADDSQLVRASRWTNYDGVMEADAPVIAALPGQGWVVEYKEDDGSTYTNPVLCWLVRSDGSTTPLDSDGTGYCDEPATVGNFVRLIPPGEAPAGDAE